MSFVEDFPGEGVAQDKQHGDDEGHLPPIRRNVELVGKAEVTNPSGAGNTGRVADVFAYGNYAYLNAVPRTDCEDGRRHVIDINDLSEPAEIPRRSSRPAPAPTPARASRSIPIDNEIFHGDVLIHQNETCPAGHRRRCRPGGISLWDVTDPTQPEPIDAAHRGLHQRRRAGTDPSPTRPTACDAWTNEFDRQDLRRARSTTRSSPTSTSSTSPTRATRC